MIRVEIFTDGACSGNPGAGGWGALLRHRDTEKELSGAEAETTNNRMELTAVIEALKALKKECNITLYTDSRYVMDGITQWLPNWKKNNWRTSNKKSPVKNIDLWQELDSLAGDTKSAGFGSRGITDILKTNVSTSWRVMQYHL